MGHPEVYILIIPGFGIISSVLALSNNNKTISIYNKNRVTNSKGIFGYKGMYYAMMSISILGSLV
jgi:heme/copper-type cytochrome/quinol oxidase subunit 1